MNITAKNLNKSYSIKGKQIKVIENFNYCFESGKLIVLKGESGRGKTTLLTLLGLLQKQNNGEIFFDDKLVSNLSNEEKCKIRRENIGIIYQDYNLLSGLTVLDNVILIDVCMNRISKKEAILKATNILDILGLGHRVDHHPNELSGGEQQRVGVARAIFKEPSILICDEPISNLDSENSERIVEFLDNYSHNKKKLVIVTCHNKSFDSCADDIILI